jgi:hypothetical protein
VFSTKLPNVEYLGIGYDIFTGNPQSGISDPGVCESVVSTSSYAQGKSTSDRKYSIPDGTQARRQKSCTTTFSTSILAGGRSFQNSLSTSVKLSVAGFGAKFTASTGYQSLHKNTMYGTHVYTTSHADCTSYYAAIDSYTPPALTTNFIAGVKSLPTTFTSSNQYLFHNFLQNFGTHFSSSILMGASIGQITAMTNTSYSQLASTGFDIGVGASASAFGVSVGVSTMTTKQQQEMSTFNSYKSSSSTFTRGSKPPPDGNLNAWFDQVITSPYPIQYTLVPLQSALAAPYTTDSQLMARRSALGQAIAAYCGYLKNQGQLTSCLEPPPDPPLPAKSNFGGTYQVDQCGKDNRNNVYTGRLSCPAGYMEHSVARMLAPESNCGANLYLCLSSLTDPQGVFGGMFQRDDPGNSEDNQPNPMNNNQLSCPTGFGQYEIGRYLTADNGSIGATLFMCLKKSYYTQGVLALGYQVADYGESNAGDLVANSITGAESCPPNFKAVDVARVKNCISQIGGSVFLCLGNASYASGF